MLSSFGNAAAASTLMFRMGTDAHLYDDPEDASIPSLLDSRFDSEKAEALKRLLALIAQGEDVSNFFPKVVKNVASQSLEVKKLVYLYLLHYAEKRQDEALLSINIFQKDLSDTNPLVRAWALRTMAGIRLHIVAPLVLVAIKKCARDPSPYVRKCAAYAISKLYDLHQEESATLEQILDILLNDNSPAVIGAAAVSFYSVCPDNLSLITKNYRRLCETVPDVEEWSQIILIKILLHYAVARHGLVKESMLFASESETNLEFSKSACSTNFEYRYYIRGEEGQLAHVENIQRGNDMNSLPILTSSRNDDVRILLQCTAPLLWSRNSGVVLAAASVHWLMAPVNQIKLIVNPLLFALRSSNAAYVMLCNIVNFAKKAPSLFAPYYEDFFISCTDLYQIKALKLEILSTIATESSIPAIFEEFQDYIRDTDRKFVADTVFAIGLCGQKIQSIAQTCLEGLLSIVVHESSLTELYSADGEDGVMVQSIMSIKEIIKRDPASHEKEILQLVRILDKIKAPTARALIIWIFGEHNHVGILIRKAALTVLRYLAWSFTSEQLEAKLQILNASAKVVLHAREELDTIRKVMNYITELAACDLNYDLRDRARLYSKLLSFNNITEELPHSMSSLPREDNHLKDLLDHIFLHRGSLASYPGYSERIFLPGSLSLIVQHSAPGYALLPKPCSVLSIPSDPSNELHSVSNSLVNDDPDVKSESSEYESEYSYDSEDSCGDLLDRNVGVVSLPEPNGKGLVLSNSQQSEKVSFAPFVDVDLDRPTQTAEESISTIISTDLTELKSKSALESWLDEGPTLPSAQGSQQGSSAKILLTKFDFEIKAKVHTLLDPSNHGLHVLYSFSSEVSSVSPYHVCVDMFFTNVTTEPITNISVKYEESLEAPDSQYQSVGGISSASASVSSPIHTDEEIFLLPPNQTMKKLLHVHFYHHLLPLKLAMYSNGMRHVAKLWPDIAYFMRPLKVDLKVFTSMESQLRGMYEYTKSCTFAEHLRALERVEESSEQADKSIVVAESFALTMLSNSSMSLVSMEMPVTFAVEDASGLCLKFSGELLGSSQPCLVSLFVEGKVSERLAVTAKVNCKDTAFGLNLLNRVATIIEHR